MTTIAVEKKVYNAMIEVEMVARTIADADPDETHPALHEALEELDQARDNYRRGK